MKTLEDQLSLPLAIISSIIPPVGFVLYFLYKKSYPVKAKKALNSAIIGIPIGIIMGFVMPLLTIKFL